MFKKLNPADRKSLVGLIVRLDVFSRDNYDLLGIIIKEIKYHHNCVIVMISNLEKITIHIDNLSVWEECKNAEKT